MALATLSIDIEARLARFEQGVNRANGLLDKLSRGATTAGQRVAEIFAGNLGANAAAQAIQRVAQLFPAVLDGVLALKDLSEATGASIENISALDDIARRTGGSLQQVEGVLIKFNMALKEADGKNTVSQALKAIGLDATELRRLDPAEALLRAATAIEQYADDGNRARLMQELFGRGVKDASAFLRELAEAGQLNATVTREQVGEFDKFNKQLANLRANISDLARSALGDLLPRVNEVLERLATLSQVYGSIGAGLAANFGRKQFADAGEGIAFYAEELSKLQAKQAKMAASGNGFARFLAGDGLAKDIEQAQKALDFYQRVAIAQGKFAGGGRGFVNPAPAQAQPKLPFIGGEPEKLKTAAKTFEDYQQSITRGLAQMIDKTDTVRLAELNAQLDRLQELAAAGLDPAIVEQVRRMLVPPQGAAAGPPISEDLERVNELLKQTDSARLQQAGRDAGLLRSELDRTTAGTQRWLALTDALIDVETQIDSLTGALPELTEQADESAQQMRSTIEGALGSALSSTLRGEFDSIGKMWANLLIDMAARAIAADILGSLFGDKGKGGSGAGSSVILSAILNLFGSARGNAFGLSGVIPFATGGVVTSPTMFTFGAGKLGVMGEAGNEAVLPLKRGPGGKLGVIASGGGGQRVQIVNNVTVHGGASRNDVLQAMALAERRAVASITDAMRRGRSIAQGA